MPATIAIYAPLPTPTLNSVVASSGGTVPAGTYRFMFFTTKNGFGYLPRWYSPPSNIIEITVPANSRLTFTYTRNTSETTQQFLLYSLNGGVWSEVVYYGQVNHATTHVAYEVRPCYTQQPMKMDFYGYKIHGLSNVRGCGKIVITGDGNFTIKDINDALQAAGAVDGEDYLYCGDDALIANYSIDARNYGVGNFDLSGKTIYLAGGFINYPSSLNLITSLTSANRSSATWLANGFNTYAWQAFELANCNMSRVNFLTPQYNSGISWSVIKAIIRSGLILNSRLENGRIDNGIELFQNSDISTYDHYNTPNETHDITLYTYYFHTGRIAGATYTYRRITFYRRETFQYLLLVWAQYLNWVWRFIDCTFASENDKSNKISPAALFTTWAYRYNTVSGANGEIQVINTISINTKNIYGDNLNDVEISCWDLYGNPIFSLMSDINGNVSQEVLVAKSVCKYGTSPQYENSIYYPLRIVAEKEGYQVGVIPEIYPVGPTSLLITLLEDVAPVYYHQQLNGKTEALNINGAVEAQPVLGSILEKEVFGIVQSTEIFGAVAEELITGTI